MIVTTARLLMLCPTIVPQNSLPIAVSELLPLPI